MHDEIYKKLFAFPRLVEDLLRGFVGRSWIDDIDFTTLHKLSAEYVGDDLRKRHGDVLWQVELQGRQVFLLVLLEFQSRDEPWMALRILNYTGLLYEELIRNGRAQPGSLPPVLPVVLYNGERPWRGARSMGDLIAPAPPDLAPFQPAQRYHLVDERHLPDDDLPAGNLMSAVVRIERMRSPTDLRDVVRNLRSLLKHPDDQVLERTFTDWLDRLATRIAPASERAVETLEELEMSIEERVAEWPKQWRREGFEAGERAMLERLARRRFGAEAAERASGLLARITTPDGLLEAGDRFVQADTADDLIAALTPLTNGER